MCAESEPERVREPSGNRPKGSGDPRWSRRERYRAVVSAPLVEHLRHDVFDAQVPWEHAMRPPGLHQPPGFSAPSVAHGERQLPPAGPQGQVPPSTSLRSGCVVPCGRRLHFDLPPHEGGGWERLFASVDRVAWPRTCCHRTRASGRNVPVGGMPNAPPQAAGCSRGTDHT